MQPKFKAWRSAASMMMLVAVLIPASALRPASNLAAPAAIYVPREKAPEVSGIYDYKNVNFGTGLTECPQAGNPDARPKPLDRRQIDQVEVLSNTGDDRRANQDYSCFPQNETAIAVNPRYPRNVVAGANDYRLGWGSSGFYASTDSGRNWYDGIIPFPSLPSGDNLDGGGDPVIAFDRDGVVYYAGINFNRTDDTNGVFVSRSTNGGFTWTRPCVPLTLASPTDDQAACGGLGDPRQPGDGVVTFLQDNDVVANSSIAFNDKEWLTVGPRPAGVNPVCFGPETDKQVPCNPAVVGVDRLYVTWTIFGAANTTAGNRIYVSYSDDQARSWSPPKAISGSAAYCIPYLTTEANNCDVNQGSVPTVNPTTGHLYVGFLNGNTIDEDQYLVVRSKDGGQTFEGPFFVSPVFDLNYPRGVNGRTDCIPRGQGATRQVLTNSCFRVNSYGNIVADKRGGQFADDLYVVLSDNRNGTIASSNTDVFLFKSTDGGSTWLGPTRVNDDQSIAPADRDCGRNEANITGDPKKCAEGVKAYGNDQWFPWVDINDRGELNVVFYDRRLDVDSTKHEWPASRQRPGNYLTWLWGAQCVVAKPDNRHCTAPEAQVIPQPTAPIDPPPGAVPGQNQSAFPFRNFTISDVPSNMDYAFRAGVFIGDYNNVAVFENRAYAFWTDARNGRSSKDQAGRNPACEQADVFFDEYDSRNGGSAQRPRPTDELFLVTPCPTQAVDRGFPGPRP